MNNQLLKAEQVAAAIGVTPKTIRLWCNSGDVFPTARKLGNRATGQWRILSDDVALLEMLDGASDNAAVLAGQNKQIADLQAQMVEFQAQIAECRSSYDVLNSAYHQSMAETDQFESEFNELADNYNKLMSIHKRTVADHEAEVADLQRYKDHYHDQQQRRRGQRRAA